MQNFVALSLVFLLASCNVTFQEDKNKNLNGQNGNPSLNGGANDGGVGGNSSGATAGSSSGSSTSGSTTGNLQGGVNSGTNGGTIQGVTSGATTGNTTSGINGSTNGGTTSGVTGSTTTGSTTGNTTSGSTTGNSRTAGATGGNNPGSTTGNTVAGSTGGVTSGTTGSSSTAGVTSGSTNGNTVAGSTGGLTSGSTTGNSSTAGSTGGITSGTTGGTTGSTTGGTTGGAACVDEIPAGVNISHQINSDWNSGYTYQIQVQNNTAANLTNWTLCFYYNQNVGNDGIWNADIASSSSKPNWKLVPKSYNKIIYAGSNVTINWNASPGGINNSKIQAIKFLNQENATCAPINCSSTPPTTPTCSTSQIPHSTAVSNNYGNCIATACEANYQVSNGQCVPKPCTLVNVANSAGVIGSLVSGCVATSCQSNYTLNNGTCSPTLCTNLNVLNSLLVTGNLVSGCIVSSCMPNYMLVGGLCLPSLCTTLNVLNALSVTGNILNGCSATSCQPNFVLVNGSCVNNLCAVSSVANATAVSGSVINGCIATVCKTNYTLSNGACSPTNCVNSHVANSASVNGTLVSGCIATSCQPNYTLTNGTCVPSVCTSNQVSNSTSVSGTLVSGCVATACKSGFSLSNGSCVAVNSCTTSNVLNSTAVSGTLDTACVATACKAGYVLNQGTCQAAQSCQTLGDEKVINGLFNTPVISNGSGWDLFNKTTPNFGWDVNWVSHQPCGTSSVPAKLEIQNFSEHQFDDVVQVAELDTDCQGPSGAANFTQKQTNVVISQDLDLTMGKTYKLSYYMKSRTGNNSSQAMVRLGNKYFKIKASQVSTNAWKKFEHIVSVTSQDLQNQKVKLSIKGKGESDSFGMFVAKVSVKEISNCAPSPQVACTVASEVVSYSPVAPIAANRNLSAKALGQPILGDVEEFVALGFGGQIVLKLDSVLYNRPGKDLKINETSFGNQSYAAYPEQAQVEVSMDGVTWTNIGVVKNSNGNPQVNELDLGSVTQAQYVRITDNSNKASFPASADGFDVESIQCMNQENLDSYYLDNQSNKIYKTMLSGGEIKTSFYVNSPYSLAALAINSEATRLYVLESLLLNRLSYINTQTGAVVNLGNLKSCASFYSLAMGADNDRLYALANNSKLYSVKLNNLAVTDLGYLKTSSGAIVSMVKGDIHIHQGKMYVATSASGGQLYAVDKIGTKLVATKIIDGFGEVTGLSVYQKNQVPTFLLTIANSTKMIEYNSLQGKVALTISGSITKTLSTGDEASSEALDIDYYQ